ncbi:MAG: hypothetical protein V1689_02680 [Pseudomonadota bacterium]
MKIVKIRFSSHLFFGLRKVHENMVMLSEREGLNTQSFILRHRKFPAISVLSALEGLGVGDSRAFFHEEASVLFIPDPTVFHETDTMLLQSLS